MVNLFSKLKALNTNIKATFDKARIAHVDDLKGKLYGVRPVNGATANIVNLVDVPGLREMKSERVPGLIDGTVATITPRTWEATLDVKQEDVEDDELGIIPEAVSLMAADANNSYGILAIEALVKGFTANLNDGTPFFDTSRGNLQSGALSADNFAAAVLKLQTQKSKSGKSLRYRGNLLTVGPLNEAAAKAILLKEYLTNGESNTNYKASELVVDSNITGLEWFVSDAKQPSKPVVIAERKKIGSIVAKTDLNSDRAFDKGVFSWGVRGRFDAAYNNPQMVVGSIGS